MEGQKSLTATTDIISKSLTFDPIFSPKSNIKFSQKKKTLPPKCTEKKTTGYTKKTRQMDSTPQQPIPQRSNPNSQTKSASRLARITYSGEIQEPLPLPLELVSSSPNKKSPLTPAYPLRELLPLSPSPSRKSRTRLADRLDMAEDASGEPIGSRRRCKSKGAQVGVLGCASPRNNRRSRRRAEIEGRDERDLLGLVDEMSKVRKRRHSTKSKKEKLSLVPLLPSTSSSPRVDDSDGDNLDRLGIIIYDLITWTDAAKSSLWFGLGCLGFLSSCFAKGINFSMFSMISQLGLLFLCLSFLSNSICQRNNDEKRREFKLKEGDILQVGRVILPAANLVISKIRELFSGEPSMTLKVAPFLLLGAEYGHLMTLWRLCAMAFFTSFTIPKLYSCYSSRINCKVEFAKCWVLETWEACSHKKIVAASAITIFWNLSSIKTRIFTAFISLVILRCCRQHLVQKQELGKVEQEEQGPQHASAAPEATSQKQ